jgi:hypothetical protein
MRSNGSRWCILGVSGRAMLDALVAGTTDRERLADLAQGKIPALKQALQCRFEAHHALVVGAILAHLDFPVVCPAIAFTHAVRILPVYV